MNRSLLMSVLIFCCLQFPTKASEDDFTSLVGADSVRLQKSFYGAMDLLRRKAAKTSGSAAYNVFSDHIVGKPMPKAEVYNIAVLNDDFMSISRNERGLDILEIVNTEYAFVLSKPKNGVYSIAGVQRKGASLSDDSMIKEKMYAGRFYILDAYSYYGKMVWELVEDPGFELLKLDAFKNEADEVHLRVDFNYTSANKTRQGTIDDFTLKNGAYLILNPRNDWKLVEYGRPAYPRHIVTVGDHPTDQLGFTQTATMKINRMGDKKEREDSIACIESSYDPVSKEHFYLSHYGFPEPNFRTPSRWPWIVAGLTLGVICIVVSRRLLRRLA